MTSTSQARRFSWTLHDWTDQHQEHLRDLLRQGTFSYVIWGREICPETGRRHLQGYLETTRKTTWSRLVKTFRRQGITTIHLEPSRGNQASNVTYCQKEGDWEQHGAMMSQGKRSDLKAAVEAIKSGANVKTMWNDHTAVMIRYSKGIMEAISALRPSSFEVRHQLEEFDQGWREILDSVDWTRSLIFWGNSGIGKTSFAKAILPKSLLVRHLDQLLSYNSGNYDGIIFDDMSFNHLPRESQIHLTDIDEDSAIHIRYTIATIPRNTKKIFTTNIHNGMIFQDDPAIARRVHIINLFI